MIYAQTNNLNQINYSTFSSVGAYVDETVKKVSSTVYKHFLEPVAVGITTGAGLLTANITLAVIIHAIGIGGMFAKKAASEAYSKSIQTQLFNVIVLAPVIEEIIFRFVIFEAFHFLTKNILPDVDVEIFSYKIKLDALVAIVATAVLFGLAHLANGTGLAQVILSIVGGITFGVLRHEFGLLSSISAHMTNNAIAVGLSSL